jgi:hypothetical protein
MACSCQGSDPGAARQTLSVLYDSIAPEPGAN